MIDLREPLCCIAIVFAIAAASAEAPLAAQRLDALGDPLPDNARLRLGTLRFQPPSSVIELTVSPDGRRVVTVGREWLIVWDAAIGKELWRASQSEGQFDLPGASYGIRALVFDPNGKIFYTPARSGGVMRWELETEQPESVRFGEPLAATASLGRFSFGNGGPRSVDVSPDGKRFALGSRRELVVYDRQAGPLCRVPNQPKQAINADDMNRDRLTFGGDSSYAIFSLDGQRIAAVLSEEPKQIRILDANSGAERRRINLPANLVRMAFSPDGKRIATTQRDCSVRSYSVETGDEAWSYQIKPAPRAESYCSALAFDPNGRSLAVCAPIGSDYSIYLLDAVSGEKRHKMTGHGWKPWAVAFSPDGKIIYSSGWAGTIQRWDPATGQEMPLPEGVRASGVVAASPAAPLLAYEDGDNQIRLVDSEDGQELRSWGLPETNFEQLAFSPNGDLFAGGGTSGDQVCVAVWRLATQELLHHWRWPKGRDEHSGVESLRFSPDSRQLAAAVFRQDVGYLWDLASGDQVAKLQHTDIYSLSFHPDSKSLVSVGWDSRLRKWNTQTGELLATVVCKGDDTPRRQIENKPQDGDTPRNTFGGGMRNDLRMYAVDHSPDGRLIATGHMNNSVRVWQTDGMLYHSTFSPRSGFTYDALRFSPDSLWIACGHSDGGVTLWDPYTRERVYKTRRHQEYVYNVSFGRNARELITGSNDGVCYLWDPRPLAWMLQSGRDLTAAPVDELWTIIEAGGEEGYHAMWALAGRPDEAVSLLREKLMPIKLLVDVEYLDPKLPPARAEAIRLQNEFRLEIDPTRMCTLTACRAISALEQMDTPSAMELLEDLAKTEGDLGRIATERLNSKDATEAVE